MLWKRRALPATLCTLKRVIVLSTSQACASRLDVNYGGALNGARIYQLGADCSTQARLTQSEPPKGQGCVVI
ncbi:hypothetical protein BDW68DRAFT_158928 [Aspergillus falconensis]